MLNTKAFLLEHFDSVSKTGVLILPGKEALEVPILDKLRIPRNKLFMVNCNTAYMATLKPAIKQGVPLNHRSGTCIHRAIRHFEKLTDGQIGYAILDFMHPSSPNSLVLMKDIGASSVWEENLGISLTVLNQRESGGDINNWVPYIAQKYCNGDRTKAVLYLNMQSFCAANPKRTFKELGDDDYKSYKGETTVNMALGHFTTSIHIKPFNPEMIAELNAIILSSTARHHRIVPPQRASRNNKRGTKSASRPTGRVNPANSKIMHTLWDKRYAWVKKNPQYKGHIHDLTYDMMKA